MAELQEANRSAGSSALSERLKVVLVGTTHPGNIGAAARAMKTMGLSRLVLVSPKTFPSAEATVRASGADDLLAGAQVVQSLEEGVAECAWVVGTSARPRHIQWPEVSAREFASEAVSRTAHASVAVVFGRENSGLSNAELDQCNALLRLPTVADFASLNLAAAVQVTAYELRMAVVGSSAAAPAETGDASLTHREMEGFHEHLERTLMDVGYFDPDTPKLLRRRLRRMFHRMAPDRSEVNILRGFLSATQRRIRDD